MCMCVCMCVRVCVRMHEGKEKNEKENHFDISWPPNNLICSQVLYTVNCKYCNNLICSQVLYTVNCKYYLFPVTCCDTHIHLN